MEWIPELTKLLRTKSIIRYLPPKGTAGLARSRVRGWSRVPCPPAITNATVLIASPDLRGRRAPFIGQYRKPRLVLKGRMPSRAIGGHARGENRRHWGTGTPWDSRGRPRTILKPVALGWCCEDRLVSPKLHDGRK